MLNPSTFSLGAPTGAPKLKSSFCDSEKDRAMANEEQEISVGKEMGIPVSWLAMTDNFADAALEQFVDSVCA